MYKIVFLFIIIFFYQKVEGQNNIIIDSINCLETKNENLSELIAGKWNFLEHKDSEENNLEFKGADYFIFKKNGKFKTHRNNEVFKGKWSLNNCPLNNLRLKSRKSLATKETIEKLKNYGVEITHKLNELYYTILDVNDTQLIFVFYEQQMIEDETPTFTVYKKEN